MKLTDSEIDRIDELIADLNKFKEGEMSLHEFSHLSYVITDLVRSKII